MRRDYAGKVQIYVTARDSPVTILHHADNKGAKIPGLTPLDAQFVIPGASWRPDFERRSLEGRNVSSWHFPLGYGADSCPRARHCCHSAAPATWPAWLF